MASTSSACTSLNDDYDEEEAFFNSDKVVSLVNLLTKNKIKLWELPILTEKNSNTEVDYSFSEYLLEIIKINNSL